MRADREFWTRKTDTWLGPWLKANSTIVEITNFVNRIYIRNELEGFKGDSQFIRDGEARQAFSKLRCSIAGLYAWRAAHADELPERQRMSTEADYAFRQAFAICPSSAEVVMRYANLLLAARRISEALSVVRTGCELYPEHPAMRDLLERLRFMDMHKSEQTK